MIISILTSPQVMLTITIGPGTTLYNSMLKRTINRPVFGWIHVSAWMSSSKMIYIICFLQRNNQFSMNKGRLKITMMGKSKALHS